MQNVARRGGGDAADEPKQACVRVAACWRPVFASSLSQTSNQYDPMVRYLTGLLELKLCHGLLAAIDHPEVVVMSCRPD